MSAQRELWLDEGSLVHAVWRYPADGPDPPPGNADWVLCHGYKALSDVATGRTFVGASRDVACLWCAAQMLKHPGASA